ncbi:MAG: hypothetical protein JNJ98_01775 [Gemmatimonadetes bacterium]|nr:hypothetical protein [Gemmatimonadota bacterium]
MRSLVTTAWVALLATRVAGGQEPLPATSGARVTAQLAAGALLTPVGFFGSGWAAKRLAQRTDWSEGRIRRVAYVAAYAGAATATAAAPALIGDRGRYGAAFLGATAGIGVSALTARLGNARYDGGKRCGLACWGLGALAIAAPSVGATVGYQLSRQ